MKTNPTPERNLSIALLIVLLALSVLPMRPGTVSAGPPVPAGETRLGIPVSTERGPDLTAYVGCGGATAPVVNAGYEQQVVDLVNAERASRGLPPLKRVTALDQAARYHATDMGQDNYFDHDTYDRVGGNLVEVCSWSARTQTYYSPWSSLAENIAAGYSTPQSVMTGWMNSSGHRANILSTGNWEIGVGYYQGSGSYYRYWAQDFGRRPNVYPLVIDRDAATTDSENVSLHVYGTGTWDEMRLRNDDGSWTAWQPFQSTLDWTLRSQAGERTVWVELRKGSQTTSASDTITLTGVATLGNLPATQQFVYSIPDQILLPAVHQATPANTGNATALTWSVTTAGTWFTASPLAGTTPDSFSVTPTVFSTDTVTAYVGALTVTVTSLDGVAGSPHRIDLALNVIDTPFLHFYLPLASKG